MKILITGATGYIGRRLIPVLLEQGCEVICCVRDVQRFNSTQFNNGNLSIVEVDFLNEQTLSKIPNDIDAAYYLIHSMSSGEKNFETLEEISATNFKSAIERTGATQVIYLSGIINEEKLSKHLASRKKVEQILFSSKYSLTALRAGVIVGSGSASFEIIRDLVEKLPIMVAPKWLNIKHQPIAIRNVLQYLSGVLFKKETFNKSYDIGGADVLTYKEMLLQFAEVRRLKRFILTVPVMTPRLSSYWLYFVTATSYKLAVNLVNSLKIPVVANDNALEKLLNIKSLSYKEAVEFAFQKIEQNNVLSSWKDSLVSSYSDNSLMRHIDVPTNGCFIDKREKEITTNVEQVIDNIWSIGGDRGWYYADWLWGLRGFIDKLFGGVGLRRGRTNANVIHTGDTLDFWRALAADKHNYRLLLYAEMKLPGEAWLEFKIIEKDGKNFLLQTATFRPKGLLGRLYWYSVLPFHHFIFNGMAENILKYFR